MTLTINDIITYLEDEIDDLTIDADGCAPLVDTYTSPRYTQVYSMSDRESDLRDRIAVLERQRTDLLEPCDEEQAAIDAYMAAVTARKVTPELVAGLMAAYKAA